MCTVDADILQELNLQNTENIFLGAVKGRKVKICRIVPSCNSTKLVVLAEFENIANRSVATR